MKITPSQRNVIKIIDLDDSHSKSREISISSLLDSAKKIKFDEASKSNLSVLFDNAKKMSNDKEKIKLIDKYARMFFDAAIFTSIPNYPLVTPLEKKILEAKITRRSEASPDFKQIYDEYANIPLEETTFQTRAQAKKSFFDIKHIAIIKYDSKQYLLGFSEVNSRNSIQYCLFLICRALMNFEAQV